MTRDWRARRWRKRRSLSAGLTSTTSGRISRITSTRCDPGSRWSKMWCSVITPRWRVTWRTSRISGRRESPGTRRRRPSRADTVYGEKDFASSYSSRISVQVLSEPPPERGEFHLAPLNQFRLFAEPGNERFVRSVGPALQNLQLQPAEVLSGISALPISPGAALQASRKLRHLCSLINKCALPLGGIGGRRRQLRTFSLCFLLCVRESLFVGWGLFRNPFGDPLQRPL